MKKIYILAENYEEARRAAYLNGYHYKDMVNIDSIEKIRGIKNITVYETYRANLRKNYDQIITEIKTRRLNIVGVQYVIA